MRLTTLHVENFRALESIDVTLHPMTVIIGENDVGKTSCLLAIQTLFECPKLDLKTDFFKGDTTRSIVIDATFACAAPTDANAEFLCAPGDLIRVRCTYHLAKPRTIEVMMRVPKDPELRDIDGQNVGPLRSKLSELGLSTDNKLDKPTAQRILREYVSNLPPEHFVEEWSEIREQALAKILPEFVFVPVQRDLDISLRMSETSLLGKLFRPLFKEALANAELDASLREVRARLKDCASERVRDLQGLLRDQLNNQSVSLTHDVDMDPIKGVTFDFGMDDERAKDIPIANRGAGVHNNLVLAMFRLLAKYGAKDFILAIEEPENSLHPRGQREMLWALQDLSKTAQVMCTTHSSVFLDLGRLEDNIVLTRTSDGNTISRSFKARDVGTLRELLGIRVSDALLSGGGNCALIVEGPTELHAYPHFFRMAGHDARALGISIIDAEGCDFQRIRRLLLVLGVYEIPAIVVLDRDAEKTATELEAYGPGGELANLRGVHLLKKGTFESYIPLDVALDVINQRYEGQAILPEEVDLQKDRLKEFQRLIYQKKGLGARFEHFKVEFGELVGRRMQDAGFPVPPDILAIIDQARAIATEV